MTFVYIQIIWKFNIKMYKVIKELTRFSIRNCHSGPSDSYSILFLSIIISLDFCAKYYPGLDKLYNGYIVTNKK